LSESDHPVADERGQCVAAFAPALVAGDLKHVELTDQVAEGDRAVAGIVRPAGY